MHFLIWTNRTVGLTLSAAAMFLLEAPCTFSAAALFYFKHGSKQTKLSPTRVVPLGIWNKCTKAYSKQIKLRPTREVPLAAQLLGAGHSKQFQLQDLGKMHFPTVQIFWDKYWILQ